MRLELTRLKLHNGRIFFLRGWEEQFLEPTETQPPQQEGSHRRHARQRSQKSKINHYNTTYSARKVRGGSRQMRRHENSKYLSYGRGETVHRQQTCKSAASWECWVPVSFFKYFGSFECGSSKTLEGLSKLNCFRH